MSYLNQKELEEQYPLLLKVFGPEVIQIEPISCLGKSAAHMIFAPLLENALRDAAKQRLLESFDIEVRVKKRKKRK